MSLASTKRYPVPPNHTVTPPSDSAPLRVLHVINGDHYAGAERVQDLLALGLPSEGFEVGWACVKPRRFPKARKAQHVPLVECPMGNKFDLRPAWQVAALVQGGGYELIHTHSPRAALVGRLAATWTGVPLVHHVHGQTAVEVGRQWNYRLSAWVERRALHGADAVIAVSESARNYLSRENFVAQRLQVVPNGVPCRGPLSNRSRPTTHWTIGMIALFRPRKGAEDLLHAVACLRGEGHDVRLRCVGSFESDPYETTLRELSDELGISQAVEWPGFSTDVAGQLARMDLLALPSVLCEGLPMVVIEAMAAGVPVLGTRVDGITDVIRDRETGLLAQPGDPHDLARVLHGVVTGQVDWHALRENAHRRQAEVYSDRQMAHGVAEVYRAVLAGRTASQAA